METGPTYFPLKIVSAHFADRY